MLRLEEIAAVFDRDGSGCVRAAGTAFPQKIRSFRQRDTLEYAA
jgi:hypothetical protein